MFRFIYVIMNEYIPCAIYRFQKCGIWHTIRKNIQKSRRYQMVTHMIYLMQRFGRISTVYTGAENLPQRGGYIMYPNHQGKYNALGIIASHAATCSLVMDRNKSNGLLVKRICRSFMRKTHGHQRCPSGNEDYFRNFRRSCKRKTFYTFPGRWLRS